MSAAELPFWNGFLSWLGHPGAAGDPQYAELRIPSTSVNLTAHLDRFFMERALNRDAVHAEFAPFASRVRAGKILFVPSYLSGPIMRWRDSTHDFDFLRPQIQRLQGEGLEAEIVPIDSAATVEANSVRVAHAISAAGKPVFIVTHSKGGLDTLHALIKDLSLAKSVGAFIPMQAPFFGSPMADVASMTPRAQWISDKVVRLYRGKLDAIRDLSTRCRLAYMCEHADQIARIAQTIPILSVATTLGSTRSLGALAARSAPTTRWIDALGFPNDGLVPVASAVFPGAPYVLIDGLMHAEPEYEHPVLDLVLDRVDLLKAALSLAMTPIASQASESLSA